MDDSPTFELGPPRTAAATLRGTPSAIELGSGGTLPPPSPRSTGFAATAPPPSPAATPEPARPITAPGVEPARRLPAPAGDQYIGTVVADRYRVISKLGEGGMGVVYLAEHVIIEKRVALKVLSEEFARKADLVQRFMQEAKAASRIGHENIVDITDFGETHTGAAFFAMEFLDGSDLAHHIRDNGAIGFERTRTIVLQICRALGVAHAKGIIHRDMKPENVYLIEREGQKDFVKVLDFGIAKISSMDNEGGARLTRTGMIFGTPEYMSPEQARGDRPDHRVDIYALGCILYEMLSGDVPFHAETFMGVLTKHMFEPPQPLRERAPNASIPPDVEAVVMRALAKDRDQRFQTMKEMALALAACGGLDSSEGWGNEPSQVAMREETLSGRLPANSRRPDSGSATAVGAMAATAGTIDPSTQVSLPAASGKGTAKLVVAVLSGVALALGGAIVVAKLRAPAAPASVTSPTQAVPPTRVTQLAPPTPTLAPRPMAPVAAAFTVSFLTKPEGAAIFKGDEKLGVTPCDLEFRDDEQVTARLKGYHDHVINVSAAGAKEVAVNLQRAATGRPTSAGGHAPRALPRFPLEDDNHPEAKPEVKPARPAAKLRDLKDPFSQ